MRIPALAMLTVSMILAAAPAWAQTYNPKYPVCLETYHVGGRTIDCRYATLEQCRVSALGRGGQCYNNPYFAGLEEQRYRRQRSPY